MDIQLQIDGKTVHVREGATIMEAINKAGAYVPHFCYHEKLSVAANCRMCMVQVEKSPKALPACATPVIDGMVVYTHSEKAKIAQRSVMEFLLINHPLDCPICDQGGECQLQDLAVGYGVSRSRYQEEKRVVFEKNLGPLISTDMTRCIHCTRCVRFGREVAGIMELGMVGRGEHSEIMPFVERTVDSELSGNMIDICPVGALTSKPFRYTARPWELSHHETVAAHDSWGSHVCAQVKGQIVKRVVPSRAPDIKECWISDRDRFSYEGLASTERVTAPMMNDGDGGQALASAPWQIAAERFVAELRRVIDEYGADKIGFFVSSRATCEEAFLLQRIARYLDCSNIDSRLLQRDFSGGDVSGLGAAYPDINALSTVLFVGAEPARELPLLASHLRQKAAGKSYLSLSSTDISGQIPLCGNILTAPEKISGILERVLAYLEEDAPQTKETLFDISSLETEVGDIQGMAERLQKAGHKGIIWLGDIARESVHYGAIVAAARRIVALTGGRLGALDDGANGIGVRTFGALPGFDGMNTAEMLRANLRAVVLFRCEMADFSEQGLLQAMLDNADLICVLAPFADACEARMKIVLPVTDFCETEGGYINGQGMHSSFAPVVLPPGQTKRAWRVLRYLGELLSVPGFDFDDIRAVEEMMKELPSVISSVSHIAEEIGEDNDDDHMANNAATEGNFSRCGGMSLYGGDMLVRRAAALQKTKQEKLSACLRMNPTDMVAIGVSEDDAVQVTDGDNVWQTTVVADASLAAKVIRFRAPVVIRESGLSVRLVEVS